MSALLIFRLDRQSPIAFLCKRRKGYFFINLDLWVSSSKRRHTWRKSTRAWCVPPIRALAFWLWRHGGNGKTKGVVYSDVNFHNSKQWENLPRRFHNVRIILIIFLLYTHIICIIMGLLIKVQCTRGLKLQVFFLFLLTTVWRWTHLVTGRVCLMLIIHSGHPWSMLQSEWNYIL